MNRSITLDPSPKTRTRQQKKTVVQAPIKKVKTNYTEEQWKALLQRARKNALRGIPIPGEE